MQQNLLLYLVYLVKNVAESIKISLQNLVYHGKVITLPLR